MKYASLFTGIGGFDLGLDRAGMECVRQVEIDPHCRKVLRKHWPTVRRTKDVAKAEIEEGSVGLVAGGFPCQDLSLAGRRAGLAGKRSGLFFQFTRIVAACRPRWVLLENVPGLLSSNGGRDMGTVLWTLGQLGYGWAYRVLDAQYFGLAQRRKRVFVVGCLGDRTRAARVLFESESLPGDSAPSREAGTRAAASLTAGSASGRGVNRPGRRREDDVNVVVATLRSNYHSDQDGDESKLIVTATLNSGGNSGGFRTEPGEHLVHAYQCHGSNVGPMGTLRQGNGNEAGGVPFIAHALRAEGADASEDGTGRGTPLIATFQQSSQAGKGTIGYDTSGIAKPMKTQQDGQMVHAGAMVRRLTPTECLRLQGFSDNWLDLDPPLSDSVKYRMIGNAVAVPCAEWIARRILRVEKGDL